MTDRDMSRFDAVLPAFDDARVAWSVRVVDVTTPSTETLLDIHSARVLSTASVGKVLLLIEAARAIAAGKLAAGEPLTRTVEDAVADSGIWQHLNLDTLPAADVARLIGLASDNLATNVLLSRIGGVDAVARTARALGIEGISLRDRVRDMRTPHDPPRLSEASAAGLAALFARLVKDDDLPAGMSRQVLDWLASGLDLSMVAAAFGLDPLAHAAPDRGLTVINKTGTDAGVRADVGVVTGPAGQLIYASIANWDASAEGPGDLRDAVLDTMGLLGAALRDSVTRTAVD